METTKETVERVCEMSLDDAIAHATEAGERLVQDGCESCGREHLQLAKWLRELKRRREYDAAHTREIADFQQRYDECVRRFNEADLERVRLRDEVAAKDAEIAELRECLREAVEWSCGNPDEACEDCVAHGGDTPCKCEKWRKMLEGGAE